MMKFTSIIFASIFFQLFAPVGHAYDACDPINNFAPIVRWPPKGNWRLEKKAYCSNGKRVRKIGFSQDRNESADRDITGMAMECCGDSTPPSPSDSCEDQWIVPEYNSSGGNNWSWFNTTNDDGPVGTFTGKCDSKPGGYVAGFDFIRRRWNDKDRDTLYLGLRCCYPSAPVTEVCGNMFDLATPDGWKGDRNGACDSQGFVREVKITQRRKGHNDRDFHGIGIRCCVLIPSSTGTSTSGSTTPPPAAPSPGASTTGGVLSDPPHIPCPLGSTEDPASLTNCICNIKGQIFDPVGSTCSCPANYEPVVVKKAGTVTECRPKSGIEFYRDSSTLSNNFPICGARRAPVDASGRTMKVATDSFPNSTLKETSAQGFDYLYANGSGSAPQYLYQSATRCECTWKDFPKSGAGSSDTALASPTVGGQSRFQATDYNTIIGQDSSESQTYGPVAITYDETANGRLGSIFGTGSAVCGCPNINEKVVADDSDDPYPASGHCVPMVSPGPFRVLTNFDPAIYDTATDSQVIDRAHEVIRKSGGVVEKITLPTAIGSSTTNLYQRKIWACIPPMTLKVDGIDSAHCDFDPARNACDNGVGGGPASEVSGNITGTTAQERFDNTINKKLACCLNEFGAEGAFVKFDCVENEIKNYSSFDDLWSSADTAAQGGQLNAILLTNAQGRWLSGFYTLAGSRCEGFSEFAGTIQPGMVDPVGGVGAQMNRVGGTGFDSKGRASIPTPGSGAGGGTNAYSTMLASVIGLGQTVPSDIKDRRRCPILVRAAMVAECPPSGGSPVATYDGPPRQCSAANDIYVHIRVEQVWEIAGQPTMKPFDTVVDRASAADISIDRIIANKYGNQCPPGQTRDSTGGGCHY